jgi:RNA polymerase sigma-70 factor (ECF subfamily)
LQRIPLPQAQPKDGRSDDELMGLAARGEREAYASLVRRHEQRLRAFCARWCGSAALGDELAQECFVELWRRRASYVPQGKLKQYLFHIAANRCKNQLRAERRERSLLSEPEPRETERTSERLAIQQRGERLQRGLEKLPELQREAVLLRYSAELDYAEIAGLLGAPEPTIRSRVFQGLIKLRRLLRREQSR